MIVLRPVAAEDAPAWRTRAFRHLMQVRARAEQAPPPPQPDVAAPDPGGEVWHTGDESDPGWLWCVETSQGAALADVNVPDGTDVPQLWDAISTVATEREWSSLVITGFLDDAVTTALASHVDSTLVATKMQLTVTNVPGPDGLQLRPMTEHHYPDFHQRTLDQYASDLLATGTVDGPAAARSAAADQMTQLLPDGLDTTDQLLFTAHRDTADTPALGEVWINLRPGRAFLYDIVVDPAHRGQGVGTQMLRAAAAVTREHDRDVLALNVFGTNDGARRLYDRFGFTATESIRSVDLRASTTMPHGTGSSSGSAT